MKKGTIYNLEFKRKRKGLTNYRKRLKILLSRKLRLVIRRSLNNINATVVDYNNKGDIIKVASHSSSLKKFGWNHNTGNVPSSYLVGYLLGKKAKAAKLDEAVLDIGLQKSIKGSRIYAVLAGAVDAGLNVPHDKEILPDKKRITGEHIVKYSELLKGDGEAMKKQFGKFLKNNVNPSDITKNFEEVKSKIDSQVK